MGRPRGELRSYPATTGAPHVRDGINLHRVTACVVIAILPSLLFGIYNAGYQANTAMAAAGLIAATGWRGAVLNTLAVGYGPTDFWAVLAHGLVIYLPILTVAVIAGVFWQYVFATVRNRPHAGGCLIIALLFSLSLPPSVPLWQVALGMSFGLVVGREIFGGTGKNFLNPTLVGLAFLYVAYPTYMVGETAWAAVDGISGATDLRAIREGGVPVTSPISPWMESFLGMVPGPIGATSTLAALIGAVLMIYWRIASLRVLAGILIGMIAAALLFNQLGNPANTLAKLSWYWHFVLGSFAFGAVFLATDPVTAAMTNTGRWLYGLSIGAMVILFRVSNAAHPDGVMFAILLGNIFAPLIDYAVIWANIRRRRRRG